MGANLALPQSPTREQKFCNLHASCVVLTAKILTGENKMTYFKFFKSVVVESAARWSEDRAPKLAAALAYYSIISLAPLLLIVIGVASLFFKQDAVQGQIAHQIADLLGHSSAEAIQSMLASSQKGHGLVATIVGVASMVVGS